MYFENILNLNEFKIQIFRINSMTSWEVIFSGFQLQNRYAFLRGKFSEIIMILKLHC